MTISKKLVSDLLIFTLLPSISVGILMATVAPSIMEPFRVAFNGFLIYIIFAIIYVLSKFIDKKNFMLLADIVFITTLGFNIDHDYWVNNTFTVGLIVFGCSLLASIAMFIAMHKSKSV
ncbi:hypothetical protein WMR74_004271 [Providencia rettgeri]